MIMAINGVMMYPVTEATPTYAKTTLLEKSVPKTNIEPAEKTKTTLLIQMGSSATDQ
jgi:hypothetical protein